MNASPTEWTYAEYARFPDDGNRYEVLNGEVLVTPSPGTRHQRVAAAIFRRLDDYVRQHHLGEMMWDLDLLFATGQFLRPDMLFASSAERHLLTERGMEGRPGLVVEVLSPTSVRIDKVKKPARYGDFGIPEYWVVDPDKRVIQVWQFDTGTSEPRVERERLVWRPDPEVPPFELDIPAFFDAARPA